MDTYYEKQIASWTALLILITLTQVSLLFFLPMPVGAQIAVFGGAVLLSLATFSFTYLETSDLGDRLRIAFGPLPFFQTEVPYNDIQSVSFDQSTFMEGWGLHYARGGWLWNVRGKDCIKVVTTQKTIRIGTQQHEKLQEFLQLRSQEWSHRPIR